jgi:hypothetical protein
MTVGLKGLKLSALVKGITPILLLIDCAPIPYPHAGYTNSRIEGRLLDQETKAPVINAWVKIGENNSARSDSNGNFIIQPERKPKYWGLVWLLPKDESEMCKDYLSIFPNEAETGKSMGLRKIQIEVQSCRYSRIFGMDGDKRNETLTDSMGDIFLKKSK